MNRAANRIGRFVRTADGAFAAIVLSLFVAVVAIWHAYDYSHDFDPEYPGLQRDHFSPYAPFAYRIAEPGDTLDLIALYLSALGIGMLLLERLGPPRPAEPVRKGLDTLIFGLLAIGLWVGAAPDPPPDGWHGLSYQAIGRASTPPVVRAVLTVLAAGIVAIVAVPLFFRGRTLFRNVSPLWRVLACLCGLGVAWRVAGVPDPEPWGFWPKWAMVIALIVLNSALASRLAQMEWPLSTSRAGKSLRLAATGLLVLCMVQAGYYVHWLHWPIPRLKVIVPGKLYSSAMPPPDGLALAHQRHGFKTIINLFNEDTPQRHPDYPAERAYAEKHGILYIRADGSSQGVDFVRKTLEAARDPENWPVLVHCHGNMDRTPAWVGIYRFIELGWPMRDILANIERHRGYRPKGGVSVLYSDVLPVLAPDRFNDDPVACQVAEYARQYAEKSAKADVATRRGEANRK